jgi:L-amino acid N-acyltransferase YncA
VIIRPVRLADAAAIAAIYAPYVTDTVITFELHTPDEAEMRARISAVTAAHPWLVAEEDGRVVGYAYGAPYRARAAYRWVAEVGIYLAMETRGRGIGRGLYTALLEALTGAGYVAAMGVMTEPNAPSTLLHERLGFRNVGTQPGIGYKHGRWYDVTFWQRDLAPRPDEPAEPGLAA